MGAKVLRAGLGVLIGKLLCFSPFCPLVSFWPSSPWSQLIAGLWFLSSSGLQGPGCERPLEQGMKRFSQVCVPYMGDGRCRGSGLVFQPSVQGVGSSGGGGKSSLTETQGPPQLPLLALGNFAQGDSPQSTSTYLMGAGVGGGRAGPALAMLWGAYQRNQGQDLGRADSASWPSPSLPRLGWGPLLQL